MSEVIDTNKIDPEFIYDRPLVREEDRYFNELEIQRYAYETERFRILSAIVRNMVQGHAMYVNGRAEKFESPTMPANVEDACNRMLISCLNQMERITCKDLEPVGVANDACDTNPIDDDLPEPPRLF